MENPTLHLMEMYSSSCPVGPSFKHGLLPLATAVYEQTIRAALLCTLRLFLLLLPFLSPPSSHIPLISTPFCIYLHLKPTHLVYETLSQSNRSSTCITCDVKFELIAPPIVQSISAKGPRLAAFLWYTTSTTNNITQDPFG